MRYEGFTQAFHYGGKIVKSHWQAVRQASCWVVPIYWIKNYVCWRISILPLLLPYLTIYVVRNHVSICLQHLYFVCFKKHVVYLLFAWHLILIQELAPSSCILTSSNSPGIQPRDLFWATCQRERWSNTAQIPFPSPFYIVD